MQGSSHDLSHVWGNAREQNVMHQPAAVVDLRHSSAWATEFRSSSTIQLAAVSSPQIANVQSPSYMPNNMYGMRVPLVMSSGMNFSPGPALTVSDKGKGKSREIDFDAAFAQFDQHQLGPTPQESAKIEELDDTADLSAAMRGASLQDQTEADFKRYVTLVYSCSYPHRVHQRLEPASVV
jgi:peroxin-5